MIGFPGAKQRISIVGRTGSGKTVKATWFLSRADFEHMPWLVYDFKRDDTLAEIEALEGVETIAVTDPVPTRPGIYFIHPLPNQGELVEAQLWDVWERGNTGVYIDEGYMMNPDGGGRNQAFRALLTQGRSKRIPMIILAQRPVWIDRFTFSESDYYDVFFLNHSTDRKKIMEYIPADLRITLPEFHSFYHEVKSGKTVIMKPVSNDGEILETFRRKLEAIQNQRRTRVIR